MHLVTIILALVLSRALASTSTTQRTHSVVRCSTRYAKAPQNGPIPTTTQTSIVHKPAVWIYSTSTPILMQQPPPVTKTRTLYTISTTTVIDPAVTDVFSTTTTFISTTTASDSTTVTLWDTTSTTSTSTTTSIVPTVVGFLPIESTVPTLYPKKRSLSARQALVPPVKGSQPPLKRSLQSHPKYENAVACKDTVNIHTTGHIVFTAPTKISKVPPQTSHVRSTSTITSTSTVVPADVLSTSTFSTTFWVTTTATATFSTTSTTTSTVEALATATTLGACAADNFIGPTFDGETVNNFAPAGPSSNVDYFYMNTDDSYDCCATCINSWGCAYSAFITGTCVLATTTGSTCTGQAQNAGGYFYDGFPSQGAVFSNGDCGYLYFAD